MNRVKTGNEQLDEIFSGGIPENSINIISGLPGTGKTILAESIIFSNVNENKKALYISTVSEPLDKIIRYLQNFDFFDPLSVGDTIMYEDLSETLRSQGLAGAVKRINDLVKETGPSYLVIDSFKALHDFSTSKEEFRRYLSEMASVLTSLAITTLWVGEYDSREMPSLPEFAIADGIFELVLKKVGIKDARYIRVLKMRGSDFYSGEHAYKIGKQGLEVFPRLSTPSTPEAYILAEERLKTGVEVLDQMISEGVWKGSASVVFGPPGSGKSLLGLHFIFKGIEAGEKGMIATMEENPTQLARIVKGFGWDLKAAIDSGMLELFYVSPVEIYIDEFIQTVVRKVDKNGTQRLLIDSLNNLQFASVDETRFREYMYSLVQTMAVKGTTTFMTSEIQDLFATSYLTQYGISHMSDNVILLHYIREQSEVKRAITVLKTRASQHDHTIRQFNINPEGLTIGKGFDAKSAFGSF